MFKDKALGLVKKYKTNDPFEIASEMNIHVFYQKLDPSIYGFYKYYKRNKYICINDSICHSEAKVTCGHELGHAILHPNLNTPFLRKNTFISIDKIEREANLFSVELLLPDDEFKIYLDEFLTISQISCKTGIPQDLLLLKYQKFTV